MRRTEEDSETKSSNHLLRDYGITIVLAILVAFLIRTYVIEAYRIPSPSMRPTLEPGDTLFVSKWDYRPFFRSQSGPTMPQLGDIVVYNSPQDASRTFIKRVIGLPGDLVEIKNGQVILNKTPVTLSAPKHAACGEEQIAQLTYGVCWEPPVMANLKSMKVPADSVFVLGDYRTELPSLTPSLNPTQKKTQPNWDVVPFASLRGKALWLWLSIDPPDPGSPVDRGNWFTRIRFERMFRSVYRERI